MLLSYNNNMTKYIVGISISIAILLIVAIILFIVLKKKNNGHVKVDNEFITNIISFLGGKDNINSVNVDNARLKVGVNDLTKVDSNSLHSLSEKGVFITGNNVKMMFKYDSKTIMKEIEKII